ncbi:unnamed protein product [Polarella glacialis]|uniref:Uncharacterized protein n=1 Tax=Polarella glacialis TaxID=89957 RepID=A0A813FVG5_POLGL|nr:unnamed protein product [Polarella glacialis]
MEEQAAALLASKDSGDRRHGLLLKAIASCPSYRGPAFAKVMARAGRHSSPSTGERYVRYNILVTLPSIDSEVVIAWATEPNPAFPGLSPSDRGFVHFAVISCGCLSLQRMRLYESREASEDTPMFAAASVLLDIKDLGLQESRLKPRLVPYTAKLFLQDSGSVELRVGAACLRWAGAAEARPSFQPLSCGYSIFGAALLTAESKSARIEFVDCKDEICAESGEAADGRGLGMGGMGGVGSEVYFIGTTPPPPEQHVLCTGQKSPGLEAAVEEPKEVEEEQEEELKTLPHTFADEFEEAVAKFHLCIPGTDPFGKQIVTVKRAQLARQAAAELSVALPEVLLCPLDPSLKGVTCLCGYISSCGYTNWCVVLALSNCAFFSLCCNLAIGYTMTPLPALRSGQGRSSSRSRPGEPILSGGLSSLLPLETSEAGSLARVLRRIMNAGQSLADDVDNCSEETSSWAPSSPPQVSASGLDVRPLHDARPLRSSSPQPADGAAGVFRTPTMMSQMFLKLKEEDHEAKRRMLNKKYESQEPLSAASAPSTPMLADTASASDCLTPSPVFCSTMGDIYEFANASISARKALKWMGTLCNVIRAWKLARANEEHLIDEASTRLETGLATSRLQPEPASIANAKKAAKGVSGPPDRHSRLSVTTVLPPSKVAVKEFDKRDTHLESIGNLYVELGDKGLRLSQAVREDAGAAKPGFMRNFREFDEGQLRNKLPALKRWQKWYESKYTSEQPCWPPSANAVSAFLSSVCEGGRPLQAVCSKEPVPPIDIIMLDRLLSLFMALQGSDSIFAATVLLLLSAPPFEWSSPLMPQPGRNPYAQLLLMPADLERKLGAPPTFVIPDMVIVGRRLAASSAIVARPMSLAKFTEIFQSLLRGFLIPAIECLTFTSYSLRRLLPTLADVFMMEPEHRAALGNWVEAPRGAAASSGTCGLRTLAPGYDDVERETRNGGWRPDEVQTTAPVDETPAEDSVSAATSSDNDEPPARDEQEPTLTAATILWFAQSDKASMHLAQKDVEYRAAETRFSKFLI